MSSAAREVIPPIAKDQINDKGNKKINSAKLNSDNLIISISIASHKTSNSNNNLILKPKPINQGGNSSSYLNLLLNTNEKEKSSKSISNNTTSKNLNYNEIEKITNIINNNVVSKHNKNLINSNENKKNNTSDCHLIKLRCRRDTKGIPILRGRKKHGITFRDNLDKNANLIDVIKVQSYKLYNAQENIFKPEKIRSEDNTSCACWIF